MAWVLVAYLIAVFPANVLAATTVDHPDAPSTPLLLRGLIQVVFIASAVLIARRAGGITVSPPSASPLVHGTASRLLGAPEALDSVQLSDGNVVECDAACTRLAGRRAMRSFVRSDDRR